MIRLEPRVFRKALEARRPAGHPVPGVTWCGTADVDSSIGEGSAVSASLLYRGSTFLFLLYRSKPPSPAHTQGAARELPFMDGYPHTVCGTPLQGLFALYLFIWSIIYAYQGECMYIYFTPGVLIQH